jgi:hypothetical protein
MTFNLDFTALAAELYEVFGYLTENNTRNKVRILCAFGNTSHTLHRQGEAANGLLLTVCRIL